MIKILAYYNKMVGSHYHRLHVPLENLKDKYDITIVDSIKTDTWENFDIFIYNRYVNLPIYSLNLLKKKFGFKIIMDMDDKVTIPFSHYMTKLYDTQAIPEKIILHLKNADYVICSTELLADNLKKYNKNVVVIPNAIDFSIDQFKYKEKKQSDKLRIVYPCSLSHEKDVRLLELSFKKLAQDINLKDKYIFTLAGYSDFNNKSKLIWDNMVKVFKLSGSYNIIPNKTVFDYMEHYDNQDVCIIPLIDDSFNRMKSVLKLNESGAKKLAVIASNVPPYDKESDYFLPVDKSVDWYNHVKYLINNPEEVKNYANKLYEYNKENYDINVINKLRINLFDNVVKYKKEESFKYKIISITYDTQQITEYDTYFNTINSVAQKSYLFEYNPIIDIIDNNKYNINSYDYLGIFSWKFAFKSKVSNIEINDHIDNNYDAYGFNAPLFKDGKDYFTQSNKYHPNLLNIIRILCEEIGIKYTDSPKYAVWSNFFVMRTELYKDYINTYVKPIINLMENKYKILVYKDAKYGGLTKEKLKAYTGLDFYTYHTFILERLISLYLHNNPQIKFKSCIGKK
ncbi:MAG TPA: hypothetical protein PKD00_00180 [Burkholderiales bacterium]|nr:hypothetical protein [Burkholderiales bacterium]